MKLRKILSAALALTMSLSLYTPALAAEAADARLTQVTLAVKGTLNVGDEYTEFYGEPSETPLGTRWSLSWSSDATRLSVTATETGKVLNMNLWETGDVVAPAASGGAYGLTFPNMSLVEAREKAEAFLSRVLSDNEKAVFTEKESESLSATSYSFRGEITLNDTATPMTFQVRVRLSDGAVTSFSRGDESDYAGTPGAPDTVTTAEKAGELLKSTLKMRLEYVWDEDRELAVLRYLPESTDDFYVDAATGALINLTELRSRLNQQYTAGMGNLKNEAMEDAMLFAPEAGATLTETELAGVAKLEDVLTKEALDSKIRAWSELGLTGFTLGSASYSVDRETGEVTARISYAKNTEEGIYRRYVTVDGKTGELLSMSGYRPWQAEDTDILSAAAAQKKGEAFLQKLWGGQFGKTALYTPVSDGEKVTSYNFTFAQKANGYFYPANSISVQVDAVNGSVMGFSKDFDDDVKFDDAQGLISLEAAIDAWAGTFPVDFGYMAIPVELNLDQPEFMPLRNAGYTYYNALKPGYAYGERDAWYTGVDAKTGEPVATPWTEAKAMTYDDLQGHWAQAALEELARYQVGWLGGKAQPDKALTQLDYVMLLASAEGYAIDLEQGDDIEWLYSYALRRGILTEADKGKDDRPITRSEMVKMLLNSLGYGPVAQLPGIFRCDFADASAIPAPDLGYAAIAQGLGIVKGDDNGNFAPGRFATRCEAAYMLWLYMKR